VLPWIGSTLAIVLLGCSRAEGCVFRLGRFSHVGFLGVAFGWQKRTRRFCFTL
jgi:hypothetical protein